MSEPTRIPFYVLVVIWQGTINTIEVHTDYVDAKISFLRLTGTRYADYANDPSAFEGEKWHGSTIEEKQMLVIVGSP